MFSKIKVEVVYALPEKQYLFSIVLKKGATVEEGIKASRILEIIPEIDFTKNVIGIYGRRVKFIDKLENGDRIEIYRPLITDFKILKYRRIQKTMNSSL